MKLAVFLSEYHHVSDIDYTLLYIEFPELFTFDNKGTSGNKSISVTDPQSIYQSNFAESEDTLHVSIRQFKTLNETKGNRRLAAQHLGISFGTTLWRRLRKATEQSR